MVNWTTDWIMVNLFVDPSVNWCHTKVILTIPALLLSFHLRQMPTSSCADRPKKWVKLIG